MPKKGLQYAIRIEELPFIQICLYALESFAVGQLDVKEEKGKSPRFSKKLHLETGGQLWGNATATPNGRKIFNIRLAALDSSAKRSQRWMYKTFDSQLLKRDFMASVCPGYEFLGDFHTHPCHTQTPRDVVRRRLWEFSKLDRDAVTVEMEPAYRVGLVVAISTSQKKSEKDAEYVGSGYSVVEYSLSNYRVWIKAYVADKNDEDGLKVIEDENVLLDCPTPFNPFFGGYSDFGIMSRRGHEAGDI